MLLVFVAIVVFLINIPFGYLRSRTRKFSPLWFFYIHAPIPFVVLIRIYSGIGFGFYTYPVLIIAFFLGQYFGRRFISATTAFATNSEGNLE